MRLLLDTHLWLWQLSEPERLPEALRSLLADETNEIFFSTASMWEIVIKTALGKLTLPEPAEQYIPKRMAALGNLALSITQAHVLRVSGLPPHHKDPFDRILIAQSLAEGIKLATHDPQIRRYELDLYWVGD